MSKLIPTLSKKIILNKASVLALLASTIAISTVSYAEPTGYNQISFSVEAEQEVENDEVTATLYKKVQAKTPDKLASELNTTINKALNTAKRYPTVIATTGAQNTYPQYNEDQKIIGWTGSVSIDLRSNDFEKTSDLIANLQQDLVIQNIQFGISEKKQKQINQELTKQASLEFKDQAKTLAQVWDMSGYQVINVSLNTNNHYNPVAAPRMMEASFSKSVPAQNFEGGNTRLSVTANGTIELIPWMK